MSVATYTSSFLAFTPRVWTEGKRLCSRSCLAIQFLTLFSFARRVEVDRARRTVTIWKRTFWFVTSSRTVPFDRIHHIDYHYGSQTTSWSLWVGKQDEVEWFTVSLILDNREKVKLWTFFGEGSVHTGMTGVLLGDDDWLDGRGDQEEASRRYLSALKRFTGLDLQGGQPGRSRRGRGRRF